MRPEPGQSALDDRIRASSVEERVAWLVAARLAGLRSVWQQVDAAGIADPVAQAEFLLRRLYPEQSQAWFESALGQLRAAHAAGRWSGFERPPASGVEPDSLHAGAGERGPDQVTSRD